MMFFSWLAVACALMLPWLTGVLWLGLLYPQPVPGRWPMLLGYGYLLGLIGTVLLLRLQAGLGLGLAYWPLFLVLGVLAWWAWRLRHRVCSAMPPIPVQPLRKPARLPWQQALGYILLLLIGFRLLGLALEVWWLPLLTWDAWSTWAVRAQLWTHAQDLIPFVSPESWWNDRTGDVHSIWAWTYPLTVSLLSAWPALAFGSWNETVANLPWIGCAMALALGFYGQARIWGATHLTALLFTWLLMSLPMLDTHIALAGYADLWLGCAFGMSFFALLQWARTGDWRQALLALLMALVCMLLKREGAVWILLLLPATLVVISRLWLWSLIAIVGVTALQIWINGGVSLHLPMLGELILSPDQIRLPYLGTFSLQLQGNWAPVINHLLIRNNWHLLPLLLPFTLVAALVLVARNAGGPPQRAGLIWVLSTLSAFYLLFFWTDAAEWAYKGTSINRIMLQFTPALVFWMLTVWLAVTSSDPFTKLPMSTDQLVQGPEQGPD